MLNCDGQGGWSGGLRGTRRLQTKIINTSRYPSSDYCVLSVVILISSELGCRKATRSNNQLNYSRLTDWELFLSSSYLFIMEVQYLRKFPRLCPFLLSFLPSAPKELFFLGLRLQSYIFQRILYYI